MSTANGEGRAAPIEISMLEVDGIVVRDVKAIVVADNALNVNLLGMTFLSRVRWTHDRGRLILEQ
jgi:aspartyl protease family protein